MRWPVAFLVLVTSVSSVHAENQHIKEARLTRAAFRCSVWAGSAGDSAESARLFNIGLREGTKYWVAVREDLTLQFEIDIPDSMRGKTTGTISRDFDLGRLYEAAFTEANAIFVAAIDADGNDASAAMKTTARRQLMNENCSILQ